MELPAGLPSQHADLRGERLREDGRGSVKAPKTHWPAEPVVLCRVMCTWRRKLVTTLNGLATGEDLVVQCRITRFSSTVMRRNEWYCGSAST